MYSCVRACIRALVCVGACVCVCVHALICACMQGWVVIFVCVRARECLYCVHVLVKLYFDSVLICVTFGGG